MQKLTSELSGGQQRPWEPAVWRRVKAGFQSKVAAAIQGAIRNPYSWIPRCRLKLTRWTQGDAQQVAAERFQRRMVALSSRVTPRVRAACFRAAWSGWCTHRRFQKRDQLGDCCKLGCNGNAADSMEHYAYCPVVHRVARARLRITHPLNLRSFVLLEAPAGDMEALVLHAILVYGTYRATNLYRNSPEPPDPDHAFDALNYYCLEAVRDHPKSAKLLDNCWS